ncbi:MAG: hypothetical protein IJ523_10705 [Succinivibrionaceae bacterium]|nr:hypothetical protein [Succinivibrionaceae bacterium]
MNRYVIEYPLTPGQNYVRTAVAVLAEGPAEAQYIFQTLHPDREILRVVDATEQNRALYGTGWYTDEEQARENAKLDEQYRQDAEIRDKIRGEISTYEPDEFAARVAYEQRRAAEDTQNAEGVHLGDMFSCEWGYEQTNVDYYQVTALKGQHTIVVRELRTICRPVGQTLTGLSRPIRDSFRDDKSYTLRTKCLDGELWINSPGGYGHLHPWKEGDVGEYTAYA